MLHDIEQFKVASIGLNDARAMEVVRGTYFKDDGSGTRLISGLPLPRDPDGVVRYKEFIACDFHPCCRAKFEHCIVRSCDWQQERPEPCDFEMK